jgi:hypothetical protein
MFSLMPSVSGPVRRTMQVLSRWVAKHSSSLFVPFPEKLREPTARSETLLKPENLSPSFDLIAISSAARLVYTQDLAASAKRRRLP